MKNKNNVVIENDGHFLIQNGILIIRGVDVSDNGKYICLVINDLAEERIETTLIVTGKLFNIHYVKTLKRKKIFFKL